MSLIAPPDRAALFAWLRRSDDGAPGDVNDLALATALATQAAWCVVDPYTESLHAAALRRAARFLAARGIALGATDTEYGQYSLRRWDAEIETYEAPRRTGGFA